MNKMNLEKQSKEILIKNDRGGYTVPTARLYPFQWNWDSGFTALGLVKFNEERAWQELEKLFEGQWQDGLLPHIIFHQSSPDYYPGPDLWGMPKDVYENDRLLPQTSGISQPPVLSTVVRMILEEANDKALAVVAAQGLYPRLLAWHRWWWRARDPENTGLSVVYHPWETGMDNSPAWDKALQRVEAVNNSGHKRRDLQQVNQAQRPSQMDYNRYMALVELFSSLKYEPEALYEQSTFKVIDLGVNSLLQRSNIDLLSLAQQFGSLEEQAEIEMRINLTRQAFQRLWSPELSIYLNWDCITNTPIEIPVAAGFLPLFARIPDEKQAKQMSYELSRWSDLCRYLVPSCSPDSADFEAKRYWRGPVWFIVNWMIGEGLEHYGETALSEKIRHHSRELAEQSGFFEYYDPQDSSGLGGGEFSWTAAIFLHWLLEKS